MYIITVCSMHDRVVCKAPNHQSRLQPSLPKAPHAISSTSAVPHATCQTHCGLFACHLSGLH